MMATLFPARLSGATGDQALVDQLTFWMAFAVFFFGLTFGLLQIVDEVPIVRREHLLGGRLWPDLAAKVIVLLPLLVLVTTTLVVVLRGLDRLPVTTADQMGQLLLTLWLTSAAALTLGLAASRPRPQRSPSGARAADALLSAGPLCGCGRTVGLDA